MFLPITATPFSRPGYRELLPCRALAPYVRCFWTSWHEPGSTPDPENGRACSAVIPDVCSDIIIVTDGSGTDKDGREISGMDYCGVNDRMFWSDHVPDPNRRLFGIRFYSWQASRFSDEPLSKSANGYFNLSAHFASAEKLLRQTLFPMMSLQEFKSAAEGVLCSLLDRPQRKTPVQNHLLLDAVVQMIQSRGSQSLPSLLNDIHTGERQLERIFAYSLSLSPKKLSSLIRYQSLWQAVCRANPAAGFDIQDAVFAYGYYDQAHLLNDFRKFHGMSLREARLLAVSGFYNTKDGKTAYD